MTGVGVDIEITNRCNAHCDFCPRDETPHQGLMSEATFVRALERVVEYRDTCIDTFGRTGVQTVDLCGLGEPLLHKLAPSFVQRVREAGLACQMNSNGALIDEAKGEALLDAGLQRILINIGDIGEQYEAVYQLPFEKTRDRILRFNEMADGRCEVKIVLVDYGRDRAHIHAMKQYWRSMGIDNFQTVDLMNRGGALYVDHMQYQQYPELAEATRRLEALPNKPMCVAPFVFLFIGYDGQYYLCCSDWKKEAPLGSVFDKTFVDTVADKMRLVTTRELVCATCNHDPANHITDVMRSVAAGEQPASATDDAITHLDNVWNFIAAASEQLSPGCSAVTHEPPPPPGRRFIPVSVR
jgi:MoaA/NifB/PqqE/SkfB family radical SAM enzyme